MIAPRVGITEPTVAPILRARRACRDVLHDRQLRHVAGCAESGLDVVGENLDRDAAPSMICLTGMVGILPRATDGSGRGTILLQMVVLRMGSYISLL